MATINGTAANNTLTGGADADAINGLGGNDTIIGAGGNDTIRGGSGNDVITASTGNDLAFLGTGNDLFYWSVGDGNDRIEGQDGTDRLVFTGNALGEHVQITTNGARTRIRHIEDNVDTDLNDVERIHVRALGGADSITVSDLTGTDVKRVAIDLAGVAGSNVGDGAVDSLDFGGTNHNDAINVALAGGKVSVTGLSAQLTVSNAEATDNLVILSYGGNDSIDASKLSAGTMQFFVDAANGNDTIAGGKGSDFLNGGSGNDVVVGDDGNDAVTLEFGNDMFAWYAGDGKDTVHGGEGTDILRLTGRNAADEIDIYAIAARALIDRNGALAMDTNDVERLQVRALGGADKVVIDDLTGTDVNNVLIDLAGTAGGTRADASVDTVAIFGSINDDGIDVTWSKGRTIATGLPAAVSVTHAGPADVVVIDGAAGNDIISANTMAVGKVRLRLTGGAGDDFIIGSAGNDTVIGGTENDTAFLGAGNDRFVWNVGDDSDAVEGQTGTDTLVIAGTAGGQTFDISADSGRAVVDGVVAEVNWNDVEYIQLLLSDAVDYVTVDSLAGTDVKQVAIDLADADNAGDQIEVLGSTGNDAITVAMSAGLVSVTGLSAQVTLAHADAFDHLTFTLNNGNDSVNAATLPASAPRLTVYGGQGSDSITGGAHNDYLSGGADNDRIVGGNGNDYLSGDSGNDVLLGGLGDDLIYADSGNDTITGGAGDDTISLFNGSYTDILDFDGDPAGGQDTLNLDALFDALGVAPADRSSRLSVNDVGGTVDLFVNADGNLLNGYEYKVATLHTTHDITIGQDIIVSNT